MDTLQQLKEKNPVRCLAFGHSVESMPILFWSTAVGGEAGELLNLIKKKVRGDAVTLDQIADECADIVIYLDLLCTKIGIDLGVSIVDKFNRVSDRVGSSVKMEFSI